MSSHAGKNKLQSALSSEDYNPNVDNQNGSVQAMGECLHNSVIVRKILDHFSCTELLQISLVNKLWKHEARSLVRNRGNLIVRLKKTDLYNRYETCQRVQAFLSDLHQMSDVPVSGIRIVNKFEEHICAPPTPAFQVPIQKVNIRQLSLKSLSVKLFGQWMDHADCPVFVLAKKLLQQFCGVVEVLELIICKRQEDFIEKVLQDSNLPRLKILKVHAWTWSKEDFENNIKAFLSRAPNLKMLHTNWDINSTLELLQETSIGFVYTNTVRAPFDTISKNVISAIKLDSLDLELPCKDDMSLNLERLNTIAPMLLQTSCTTTLRKMVVEAMLAVPLMCYGVCLKNVKSLRMKMDFHRWEIIEPQILAIVKNFDFTRIFPNLNEVVIQNETFFNIVRSKNHIDEIIRQANAVLVEPLEDRAARIKKLELHLPGNPSVATQYFCEMFPSIEELKITKYADTDGMMPFTSIWNWSELKDLSVGGNVPLFSGDLDSVFCGIFPEEAAELRLKDDEYLRTVNIVPVLPALTCLKNITVLSLRHDERHYYGPLDNNATFLFSKVTAFLAFARMPNLAVSIHISARRVPPAMTHLEPYVSVTSELIE